MEVNKKIKSFVKLVLKYTPFKIVHMGAYIRGLYFWKHLRKMPIEKFEKILDAGCGAGDYAIKLATKYPHLMIDAFDIKKHETWNNKTKNVNFRQKDLSKLKENKYYDFCYCIDVLEHILGNRKVLDNIYKTLKNGSYFYLHIPNNIQRRIFPKRYFFKSEKLAKEEHTGEIYSKVDLKKMLESAGFKIIVLKETFRFFGRITWEIDRITDNLIILKIILMPIMKVFAHLELYFGEKDGNGLLVLAQKTKI